MVKKDDDASSTRSGRRRSQRTAPPQPPGPGSSGEPEYVSDPLSQSPLIRAIEAERAQLLQAYSLLKCLYETLLYADEEDATLHADVANVAAKLIDESVTRLDFVRLAPMIEALGRITQRNPDHGDRTKEDVNPGQPGTGNKVEDRSYPYKVEDKPHYLC